MQRERIEVWRTESIPDGRGGFTDGEPYRVLKSLADVSSEQELRIVEAEQISFRMGVKVTMWARSGVELRASDTLYHRGKAYTLQGPPKDKEKRGRMWELKALSR